MLVNLTPVFFQVDENGTSPLHAAARAGRPLLVELFLNFDRHSADLVDVEGRTALHIAAMFGHQVSSLHHSIPCSFYLVLVVWNLLNDFLFFYSTSSLVESFS